MKLSELREWISTSVAIIALVVSGYACVQARQANQARREAITFTARENGSCRAEYFPEGDRGEIGLCWSVILANNSEERLSIVKYRVFSVLHGQLAWFGGFHNLEDENGKPVSLPLTLDGGGARSLILRAGFPVPTTVAHIIEQMPQFKSATRAPVSLSLVQKALAKAGIDYFGSSVQPKFYHGKLFKWSLSPGAKHTVAVLHIETGRGNVFNKAMSYP